MISSHYKNASLYCEAFYLKLTEKKDVQRIEKV